MKKNPHFGILLTLLFCLFVSLLTQDEALAIGEDNSCLQLLSSKYPPHEYAIEVVERKEEVTSENLIQSTFRGPGSAIINFTGSFAGTVRITGGVTIGSMLGPGMINTTAGSDNTKSISLSQNYAVKMLNPEVYILTARPIYEYCKFNIRSKRTGKIVSQGHSERPIGLQCTHYTQEEKDEEDVQQLKEMSSLANPEVHGEKTALLGKESKNTSKEGRLSSFWAFLERVSE